MTWPLLLLAAFVAIGVRSGGRGRTPLVLAMVTAAATVGYAYAGLGRVH